MAFFIFQPPRKHYLSRKKWGIVNDIQRCKKVRQRTKSAPGGVALSVKNK
jgi:hypothetical protein